MEIQLYSNSSPKEKVDKAVTLQATLQGYLKEGTSMLKPTITRVISATAPASWNYMYIPDFQRYYFIDDIINLRADQWEIHAHVDVLMSWKSGIRGNNAIIARQASKDYYNTYLKDDQLCLYADTFTMDYYFGNSEFGSSTPKYFLTVAGYISDSTS